MRMNRREFIGAAFAGGMLGMLGGCSVLKGGAGGRLATSDPFQMVPLGKTGLKVSLVGMGTGMRGWMRESDLTRQGRDKALSVIRHAFERGVRFFDCADTYGSHPYVAEALHGIPRDKYFLSSKIWFLGGGIPETEKLDADRMVARFLKELKTDHLDLVLIHCQTEADWPEKMKRQMDIMAGLKQKGMIRAHGVSVHSLEALKACVDCAWVDSVHVRINAYGQAMDDSDPAVVAEVVKKLRSAGKGLVGMKLIGEGRFRDAPEKIDKSIQYALGLVDTMIVGFVGSDEIDDFAARVGQALKARASGAPMGAAA